MLFSGSFELFSCFFLTVLGLSHMVLSFEIIEVHEDWLVQLRYFIEENPEKPGQRGHSKMMENDRVLHGFTCQIWSKIIKSHQKS